MKLTNQEEGKRVKWKYSEGSIGLSESVARMERTHVFSPGREHRVPWVRDGDTESLSLVRLWGEAEHVCKVDKERERTRE